MLIVLSGRFPKILWSQKQKLLVNDNKSVVSRPLQVLYFLFEQVNKNHDFTAIFIEDVVSIFLNFMEGQYHLAFPHEVGTGNLVQIVILGENDEESRTIEQYNWSGRNKLYSNTVKIKVT